MNDLTCSLQRPQVEAQKLPWVMNASPHLPNPFCCAHEKEPGGAASVQPAAPPLLLELEAAAAVVEAEEDDAPPAAELPGVSEVNSMGSLPPSKDLTCTGEESRGCTASASSTANHPGQQGTLCGGKA